MTDKQREAINILKRMDTVTVGPALIADALGMNVGVLRKHVRDGDYLISKVDVCGDRIRFFRKDFLEQIGEIEKEPEEPTDHQLMVTIVDALIAMLNTQKTILQLVNDHMKETAGAATPTVQ